MHLSLLIFPCFVHVCAAGNGRVRAGITAKFLAEQQNKIDVQTGANSIMCSIFPVSSYLIGSFPRPGLVSCSLCTHFLIAAIACLRQHNTTSSSSTTYNPAATATGIDVC